MKDLLLSHLQAHCHGQGNARTGKGIAEYLHIQLRDLVRCVEELRREGVIIGSTKADGYYIPANKDEVDRYLAAYRSTVMSQLVTFNRQKRARYAMGAEQGRLF